MKMWNIFRFVRIQHPLRHYHWQRQIKQRRDRTTNNANHSNESLRRGVSEVLNVLCLKVQVSNPWTWFKVVHKVTKSLAAKNASSRLTEAVAAMVWFLALRIHGVPSFLWTLQVKEPDSPNTGRIREERFRNVLKAWCFFLMFFGYIRGLLWHFMFEHAGSCQPSAWTRRTSGTNVGCRETHLALLHEGLVVSEAIFPEKGCAWGS